MKLILRSFCVLAALLGIHTTLPAQLRTLPVGGNKKASVSEMIGLTDVTIRYNRPGVKGRDGKIWGQLIPAGYVDLGFNNGKKSPWRAGANESTTIEFSNAVKINGKPLPAGKYAFFIDYNPEECTLIFNKDANSWGSYFYDEKANVLQVKSKPVALKETVEWLRFEFLDQAENSATIALEWEKLRIPFKVEVDYLNDQLASFRAELHGDKGFNTTALAQAAQFTAQNNLNLEEGLAWAERGVLLEKSFSTLSAKALVLNKLGRTAEADAAMKEALPLGKMQEIHAYGRSLIAQKRPQDALQVFKLNYDKNPGQFTVMMGMVRGYSATGDYKQALAMAEKAKSAAPDKANKDNIEKFIPMLKEGKDIN